MPRAGGLGSLEAQTHSDSGEVACSYSLRDNERNGPGAFRCVSMLSTVSSVPYLLLTLFPSGSPPGRRARPVIPLSVRASPTRC